jgi:hypothetical protein
MRQSDGSIIEWLALADIPPGVDPRLPAGPHAAANIIVWSPAPDG